MVKFITNGFTAIKILRKVDYKNKTQNSKNHFTLRKNSLCLYKSLHMIKILSQDFSTMFCFLNFVPEYLSNYTMVKLVLQSDLATRIYLNIKNRDEFAY